MTPPSGPGSDLERLLLEDIGALASAADERSREERGRWREGEVRPAGVLFLDVVGFTGLSKVLPSEQLSLLVDRTFKLFHLDCQAQGGVLDKVIGDAALFVFAGSPDHPPPREAALRAGLAILARMAAIARALPGDLSLGVRVGVSWGEVTRQRVGGEQMDWTVMGKTVNLAQRLESSAPPGTLLTVAPVVEGLEEVFAWGGHETLDLKGFGPTPTLSVTATRDAPRLRSSTARLTPLVGRDDEVKDALSTIEEWGRTSYEGDLLDPVATGARVAQRGRLLAVSGPAAVGKSRLAWEIARRLRQDGAAVATAHALQSGGGLLSFTRELARLGGLAPDGLKERFAALLSSAQEAMGEEYAERQRRHLPVLAFLLQSPEVDTAGIAQADPGTFATAARLALRSLCELVHHSEEGGRPIVLVVEDLQWLGDLQDLMGDLLSTTALRTPLVVVGSARPEWEFPEEWEEACQWHEISLPPLPLPLAKALVQARLPGLELPQDLWTRVLDKAEGVPYYLEEFANVLADKGHAEEDDGQWTLVRPPDTVEVPDDVVALVLSRLDLLPQDQKELTGKAAVLGRAFLLELLQAVERRLDDGRPDTLPSLLGLLAQAGILHPDEEDADTPTPERYLFAHLLTRDAAYQTLLQHNRTLLHKLAADALLALHPEGTAGELDARLGASDHYEKAGLLREALRQSTESLDTMAATARLGRWQETWGAALRLLESAHPSKSPGSTTKQGHPWEPPADYPWIPGHEALGDEQGKAVAALAIAVADLERRRRQGDARSSVKEALGLARHPALSGDSQIHASLSRVLTGLCAQSGDLAASEEWAERALEIDRTLGSKGGLAHSLSNRGIVARAKGEFIKAVAYFDEALEMLHDGEYPDKVAALLNNRGLLSVDTGKHEEAEADLARSLEMAREVGNLLLETSALGNLAFAWDRQGDLKKAKEAWQESLALSRTIGDLRGEALWLGNIGMVEFDEDNLELAARLVGQARTILQGVGDERSVGMKTMQLGHIDLELGNLPRARKRLESSLSVSRNIGHPNLEAQSLALMSLLCHLEGDAQESDRNLAQARRMAGELDTGSEGEMHRAVREAEERIQRHLDC